MLWGVNVQLSLRGFIQPFDPKITGLVTGGQCSIPKFFARRNFFVGKLFFKNTEFRPKIFYFAKI